MEGFGRRATARDVSRDRKEQDAEAEEARFERAKARVVAEVLAVDQNFKALTGRKPDQYEAESGMPLSELFPDGGHVLNIGDPWQVLDLPGVTTLEYETGEENSFVRDKEAFFDSFDESLRRIREGVEFIEAHEDVALGRALMRILALLSPIISRYGIQQHDYLRAAELFSKMAQRISERPRVPSGGYDTARELWYEAVRLGRGLEDIHFTETVVEPAVDRAVLSERGLTTDQEAELRRQLVESFRGGKKYKLADLVKGAFPNSEFEPRSFDRVVASWSVSAHMFGVMDERQYEVVWKELDRILKRDGAAYILPLYYSKPGWPLVATLREHRAAGGDAACIFWNGEEYVFAWMGDLRPGTETNYFDIANTLVFLPKGTTDAVRRRVERAFAEERRAAREKKTAAG